MNYMLTISHGLAYSVVDLLYILYVLYYDYAIVLTLCCEILAEEIQY